jgi:hypothetical protein
MYMIGYIHMYVEVYMIPLISNLTQRGSMFQPLAKKWLFIWNLPVDKSDWWTLMPVGGEAFLCPLETLSHWFGVIGSERPV